MRSWDSSPSEHPHLLPGEDWYNAQVGEHEKRKAEGQEHIDRNIMVLLEKQEARQREKLTQQAQALAAGALPAPSQAFSGGADLPQLYNSPDGRQILARGTSTVFCPHSLAAWELNVDKCCSSREGFAVSSDMELPVLLRASYPQEHVGLLHHQWPGVALGG